MPLRDHFRPPLSDRRSWEGFHGGWPMMIVDVLGRSLPPRYIAEPQVHLGASIEVDVATYEDNDAAPAVAIEGPGDGGPAAATWAPPRPTLSIASGIADPAEYAVRVYDERRGRRLVAAVELVSPANKDRPEHRRAFVAKCVALLQERVCVAVVDVVTTRPGNLYAELMDFLDGVDPSLGASVPPLYAVACRSAQEPAPPRLETWAHTLEVGRVLPTLPLWLAPGLAIPLDLEASYEATCRVLRIP
jgi:hypothetical protein